MFFSYWNKPANIPTLPILVNYHQTPNVYLGKENSLLAQILWWSRGWCSHTGSDPCTIALKSVVNIDNKVMSSTFDVWCQWYYPV